MFLVSCCGLFTDCVGLVWVVCAGQAASDFPKSWGGDIHGWEFDMLSVQYCLHRGYIFRYAELCRTVCLSNQVLTKIERLRSFRVRSNHVPEVL